MSLPPTMRQLVDRLEVLERECGAHAVVVVSTVQDAEGIDSSVIVIIDGVPAQDPDYEGPDRYPAVLGPEDVPVVDRSPVVEEALHRPEGIRHSLETVIRWIPKW